MTTGPNESPTAYGSRVSPDFTRAFEAYFLDDEGDGYAARLVKAVKDVSSSKASPLKDVAAAVLSGEAPEAAVAAVVKDIESLPNGVLESHPVLSPFAKAGHKVRQDAIRHVDRSIVARLARVVLNGAMPDAARAEILVPGLSEIAANRFLSTASVTPAQVSAALRKAINGKAVTVDELTGARLDAAKMIALLAKIGFPGARDLNPADVRRECVEFIDHDALAALSPNLAKVAAAKLSEALFGSAASGALLATLLPVIKPKKRLDLLKRVLPAISVRDLQSLSLLPADADLVGLAYVEGSPIDALFVSLGIGDLEKRKAAFQRHSRLLNDFLIPTSKLEKLSPEAAEKLFMGSVVRKSQDWYKQLKLTYGGPEEVATFKRAASHDSALRAKCDPTDIEACWGVRPSASGDKPVPNANARCYFRFKRPDRPEAMWVAYPAFIGEAGQRYYRVADCFGDGAENGALQDGDLKNVQILSEAHLVALAKESEEFRAFGRGEFDNQVKHSRIKLSRPRPKTPAENAIKDAEKAKKKTQALDEEWAKKLDEDEILAIQDQASLEFFVNALDPDGAEFGFGPGTAMMFDGGVGYAVVKAVHPSGTAEGGAHGSIVVTFPGNRTEGSQRMSIPEFARVLRGMDFSGTGADGSKNGRCPAVSTVPQVTSWLAESAGLPRAFKDKWKGISFDTGAKNFHAYSAEGRTETARYFVFGEEEKKGKKTVSEPKKHKKSEGKKNETTTTVTSYPGSIEILAIDPAVGIVFNEGGLVETEVKRPETAEEEKMGLKAPKENKPSVFTASKQKVMRPWQFAAYMRQRVRASKKKEIDYRTASAPTDKDGKEKPEEVVGAGGPMSMLGRLVKQGASIHTFGGAFKLIGGAIHHEMEQYDEVKAASLAEGMVNAVHLDKMTQFGHEVAEDIRRTSADKTKKPQEAKMELIDKLPARKKHQKIFEILHNPASPAWEIRAALMAQVKGYGVLYNDAGLSTTFGHEHGYSHLEGTLMWYKRVGFRYPDRWLREYREQQAKTKKPFDERELMSYAAKKEYADKHVLAGFWKAFQKTVDEGVTGAEKKMLDDCERLDKIEDVNAKIMDKLTDKEYAGAFKGLERAWTLDSDGLEMNRIPFIMVFGGASRELWAMENGIRESLLKHEYRQEYHRIPALKYMKNESMVREFQELVLRMAQKKAVAAGKDSKEWERHKNLRKFFEKAATANGEDRTELFKEMNKFWTSDGQEILDMLLLKDPAARELAEEKDDTAKRYVSTCDALMKDSKLNLKESVKFGYNDYGNSLTYSPGRMYEEALKYVDERRGDDTNFALSAAILKQFEKWFDDIRARKDGESARREYRRIHRILVESMRTQEFSIKNGRNVNLAGFWEKAGLFSGMADQAINNASKIGAGAEDAPSIDYLRMRERDEKAFFGSDASNQVDRTRFTIEEHVNDVFRKAA